MPQLLDDKRLRKAIRTYRDEIARARSQGDKSEGQLRRAFANLLSAVTPEGWEFHEETSPAGDPSLRYDGLLLKNAVRRGVWEAKDPDDKNLEKEVEKKRKKGYPLDNTVFENTRVALVYQDDRLYGDAPFDLEDDDQLARLLHAFFGHTRPQYDAFDRAVVGFKERVRSLSEDLDRHLKKAHAHNAAFRAAFAPFADLCRDSINPDLTDDDIDRLLIQHLLIQRLIDAIFDTDFFQKNAIAREIEAVVSALTGSGFSREAFHRELDFFYDAIEGSARLLGHGPQAWASKQKLLNDVYERFFQGYDTDVADTHGIVYTPQEIVEFMCASVEHVLRDEFGLALGDDDVVVLDPCTGTGNFIVNLLKRIPLDRLEDAYARRLFANEIQLLPYYIAALNIEHTYYERTGNYVAFPGLCFVDTLALAEPKGWLPFGSEENTERVSRQRQAPVTVVIGNPPYNFGQKSENDNNKNRKYPVIDREVRETYSAESTATLKNSLFDPFVKFFRWATDRLGDRDGIVCFVSNNAFLDNITFDGMRKYLLHDFDTLYHVDLRGNVRQNPKLSGTAYNVFGIQVGVGITLAIRKRAASVGPKASPSSRAPNESEAIATRLHLHRFPLEWRRRKKLEALASLRSVARVEWTPLQPDTRNRWLIPEGADEFARFVPLGDREAKASAGTTGVLFATYCGGVKTNRDDVVYGFDRDRLAIRVRRFIDAYLEQLDRYKRRKAKAEGDIDIDTFVDATSIKWDGTLKEHLRLSREIGYDPVRLREATYRPFVDRHLYFETRLINRVYLYPSFFPTSESQQDNRIIAVTDLGSEKPFMTLASDRIMDLHIVGAGASSQCFPFYTYDEDGSNRRENITDWALDHFRAHYGPQSLPASAEPLPAGDVPRIVAGNIESPRKPAPRPIQKWDIFHYVYAVLHHPAYRSRFAEVLKKELPRIPLLPEFPRFVEAGRALAALHVHYDHAPLYDPDGRFLRWTAEPPSWRVEKMRLSKDRTTLAVNPTLTLGPIPPEAFDYRLGNRSALEWVVDQYRIDPATGEDPNRPDDPQSIVRHVQRVLSISLATVGIVNTLPDALT
jgi:predicted helicase